MAPRPLRFVLLQARNPGDLVRAEELACFVRQLDVAPTQVQAVDVLSAPLGPELFEQCDALLVGGSGEYSVLDDDPRLHRFIDFLGQAADAGHPTFASCFGFQAMSVALGGEVSHDATRAEVGTFEIALCDEAQTDPLFGHLPAHLHAQQGHKDHVDRLPAGATWLARSSRSPHQAFRYRDHLVWATQFHAEMTASDNRQRIERYRDRYQQESDAALATSRETPHASSLLGRFKELLEAAHDDPERR